MKALATLAIGAAASIDISDLKFAQFIAKYGKQYASMEEYLLRKSYFMELDREIERLNAANLGSRHGHNHFSDLSDLEYRQMLSPFKLDRTSSYSENIPQQEQN